MIGLAWLVHTSLNFELDEVCRTLLHGTEPQRNLHCMQQSLPAHNYGRAVQPTVWTGQPNFGTGLDPGASELARHLGKFGLGPVSPFIYLLSSVSRSYAIIGLMARMNYRDPPVGVA